MSKYFGGYIILTCSTTVYESLGMTSYYIDKKNKNCGLGHALCKNSHNWADFIYAAADANWTLQDARSSSF